MKHCKRALPLLVLLTLAGILYFRGLGALPFYTVGEPREALEVWEEIHTGEWILPQRDGIDLPSKPPLFHWLGGFAALATGQVDEFSVRLPSALLATLTLLLVYWFGRKRWGPAAGMYAACILTTNFEWIHAARSARVDMTLTAFLTGAFIAWDVAASTTPPSPLALVALYSCMATATLAKGPIGLLLPALVVVVHLALRRDLGGLRRLHFVPGATVALGVAGLWYGLAIWHGGPAFVQKQLVIENVMTFVGWASDPGTPKHSFLYDVPAFFAGFAPWSVFTIPLAISLYRQRRRLDANGDLRPLVWFAAVFVFFTVAAGKRTVYLLPVYPAAALLLGAWWSRLGPAAGVGPRVLPLLTAATVAFVLLLVGTLAAEALGLRPLDLIRPFLHHSDQAHLPLVRAIIHRHAAVCMAWAAVLVGVTILLGLGARRKSWEAVFAALVIVVVTTTMIVNDVFHPELARGRTFKSFLFRVRQTVGDGGDVAFYNSFDYGTVFYWGERIPMVGGSVVALAAAGHPRYLLVWESELNKLTPAERQRVELVQRSEEAGPDGHDRLGLVVLKSEAAR